MPTFFLLLLYQTTFTSYTPRLRSASLDTSKGVAKSLDQSMSKVLDEYQQTASGDIPQRPPRPNREKRNSGDTANMVPKVDLSKSTDSIKSGEEIIMCSKFEIHIKVVKTQSVGK